ncbi:MAG: hypothetical protein F6K47_13415 [Symploca sp. SIO2E6]|nr:hypothetical protein [Symploca sp. SIO2E6]
MSEIDPLKAYTEACSALRHYSNASLTVRITSVIQGIALLIAWAYVLTRDNSQYAITIPIAGFLFTGLLYNFHKGYFKTTENFYESVAKMEEKFFEEDCRPFATYLQLYRKIYGNIWNIFLRINATFTLVGSLFFIAFIISLFRLIYYYQLDI